MAIFFHNSTRNLLMSFLTRGTGRIFRASFQPRALISGVPEIIRFLLIIQTKTVRAKPRWGVSFFLNLFIGHPNHFDLNFTRTSELNSVRNQVYQDLREPAGVKLHNRREIRSVNSRLINFYDYSLLLYLLKMEINSVPHKLVYIFVFELYF